MRKISPIVMTYSARILAEFGVTLKCGFKVFENGADRYIMYKLRYYWSFIVSTSLSCCHFRVTWRWIISWLWNLV